MTRSELIMKLAERHPDLSLPDVRLAVATILKGITATLANDGRVEIRGFGTLRVSNRKPRVGRNPRTGEEIDLPQRKGILFRPAIELRERVNAKQKQVLSFKRKPKKTEIFSERQAA